MSRLDKIKARADAATKGPWLQDGPWWTDDGGPEPTALPCVVDVDRALVVFPPDATDVGMKRPEDRAANMAFIAAAREDVPWLIERIGELNGAICWDTTCLNCASLLDSNYDQYMRAEIAEAEVERLTAERDALAAQVARVESLAEEWSTELDENRCPAHAFPGCDCHEGYHHAWDDLRAALAGPTALDAMGADQ